MPITKTLIIKGLLGAAAVGGVTSMAVLYKEEISDLRVWAQAKSGSMLGGRGRRRKRDLESRGINHLGLPDECILVKEEKKRECSISPQELMEIKFSIWREGEMKIVRGEGFGGMKLEVKNERNNLFFYFKGVDRPVELSNGEEKINFKVGGVLRYVVDEDGRLKEYSSWRVG